MVLRENDINFIPTPLKSNEIKMKAEKLNISSLHFDFTSFEIGFKVYFPSFSPSSMNAATMLSILHILVHGSIDKMMVVFI